jgi:hypothetical protein
LGDGSRHVAEGDPGHHTAWLGAEAAGGTATGALTDGDAVGAWLDAHDGAGAEEVLLMPCRADSRQVDLLADIAIGRRAATPSAA